MLSVCVCVCMIFDLWQHNIVILYNFFGMKMVKVNKWGNNVHQQLRCNRECASASVVMVCESARHAWHTGCVSLCVTGYFVMLQSGFLFCTASKWLSLTARLTWLTAQQAASSLTSLSAVVSSPTDHPSPLITVGQRESQHRSHHPSAELLLQHLYAA